MSSITAAINELNGVRAELARLRIQTRQLNTRKKNLEKQIVDFLDAKDQPGIKYQGVAIIPEEKESYKAKPKKQKEEDVQRVLQRYGIEDSSEAYKEIMQTMKGSPTNNVKLKIKKIR